MPRHPLGRASPRAPRRFPSDGCTRCALLSPLPRDRRVQLAASVVEPRSYRGCGYVERGRDLLRRQTLELDERKDGTFLRSQLRQRRLERPELLALTGVFLRVARRMSDERLRKGYERLEESPCSTPMTERHPNRDSN